MDKYVKCQLLKKEIEQLICYDIQLVAENVAPIWSALEEATNIKDFKCICLNCILHVDE